MVGMRRCTQQREQKEEGARGGILETMRERDMGEIDTEKDTQAAGVSRCHSHNGDEGFLLFFPKHA